jgi:hypothetical protein
MAAHFAFLASNADEDGFEFDIDGCRQTFEHFDQESTNLTYKNSTRHLAIFLGPPMSDGHAHRH